MKAKAIRKYVDKIITLAKKGDLHARRQVRATETSRSLSEKKEECPLNIMKKTKQNHFLS